MNTVDLAKVADYPNLLLYGAPGTGKTHMLASCGELGKTLFLDIDMGCKTLAKPELLKFRSNLTIASISSFSDLDKSYKLAMKNDPELWSKELGIKVTEPFKYFVWDTWSEMQWSMMDQLRTNNGIQGVAGSLGFRKRFEIQHWGDLYDLNKLALVAFRDLPIVCIFSMQEQMDKDELSGQIYGGPAIQGKLAAEIGKYFDVVARTYVDLQGNYCATTKSKGSWQAKTRLGVGQVFINPSMKNLLSIT